MDKLGRTTKTIAKYVPGGDRTLDYAFDARGDLLTFTLTEPSGALVHAYTYAADSGRIATATLPGSATPITIARWPHDGEKLVTYPGGVTREVDYDVRGPVSEIRIKPPAGTPLIEKWAYAYTDVRNVATMTDAASRVTTYGYDNLDRLTSADHPTLPPPLNTLPDLETFTYDGVGNRTMSGYAHDANHRMRTSPGRTVDYDDDGNTKVRDPGLAGQATYTWDQDNRLTAYASGATSASYRQDPFARRFKKTVGSTTTWYLWAGDQLLAEYGGSGTRSARYTQLDGFAPAQMAVPNGGSELVYAVHADRLDTPRMMTSAAGTVVWQAAYQAYGNAHLSTALSTPLNVRLPGQYLDAETGAHYNRFRYNDPGLGRYLSADPFGQVDGVNTFVYAGLNPIDIVDPFGLATINREVSTSQSQALIDTVNRAAQQGISTVPLSDLLGIVGLSDDAKARIDKARGEVEIQCKPVENGKATGKFANQGDPLSEMIPGAPISISIDNKVSGDVTSSDSEVDLNNIKGVEADVPGPFNPGIDRIRVTPGNVEITY